MTELTSDRPQDLQKASGSPSAETGPSRQRQAVSALIVLGVVVALWQFVAWRSAPPAVPALELHAGK